MLGFSRGSACGVLQATKVCPGVRAAGEGRGTRRGRVGSGGEEVKEYCHRIGEVDPPVIVRVGGVEARRLRPAVEEMPEDEDGIGDVEGAVPIRFAPVERGIL